MNKNFSTKIVFASRELSKKETVKMKDISDAVKLDSVVTEREPLVIVPESWFELEVHNEKSSNPDYSVYIVLDTEGNKYQTGSDSFWQSFVDIMDEREEDDEPWEIKIYRLPSKNYSGKSFITCSLA